MTCCLGFDADDFEDEDEDDPEIKNDPIYSLDLQVITLNRSLNLSVYRVSLYGSANDPQIGPQMIPDRK